MTKEQFFIGLAVCMSALSLYGNIQKYEDKSTEHAAVADVRSLTSQVTASNRAVATQGELLNTLRSEVYTLQGQVSASNRGVTIEQELLNTLRSDLNSLSFQLYTINGKFSTTGTFTPTDTGFQFIATSYGNLLVSLKSVDKFGDGYKMIFNFGNPTSIGITGMKGKIKWRPAIDYSKYISDEKYKNEIDQNTHSKAFTILTELYPGTWNMVSVSIGPANEKTIGQIEVSDLQSDTVIMRAN